MNLMNKNYQKGSNSKNVFPKKTPKHNEQESRDFPLPRTKCNNCKLNVNAVAN